MNTQIIFLVGILYLIPAITQAQQYFGAIDNFFLRMTGFINSVLVPFIFTVALAFFIYGAYKHYIYKGATSDVDREKGKDLMIYAIVGFVLMVSIWGIVNFLASGLQSGLGTSNQGPTQLPGLPTIN